MIDVKTVRERAGLTQAGLAHVLGVTVGTVYRWEHGKCQPHGVFVRALEKIERKAQ